MATQGRLISVRECKRELESYASDDALKAWTSRNSKIFLPATAAEGRVVANILAVQHFQQIISATARLKGKPVADPFLVASAKERGAIVVTEELFKDNAAKIPNICKHFGVHHITLEEMMDAEKLTF